MESSDDECNSTNGVITSKELEFWFSNHKYILIWILSSLEYSDINQYVHTFGCTNGIPSTIDFSKISNLKKLSLILLSSNLYDTFIVCFNLFAWFICVLCVWLVSFCLICLLICFIVYLFACYMLFICALYVCYMFCLFDLIVYLFVC